VTRLFLVRHAQSVWNAEKRWQGRGDPPLSERGRQQAKLAASAIVGVVDVVVASPQKRARETAEVMADELGLGPVTFDDDLREIDVGAWTGLTIDEVEARYSAELAAWRAGELDAPPGGEDRHAFLERILRGVDRIVRSHDGRRVLVVTHGGVIGRLERHFGCHPGRGSGNLTGRWFEHDGELKVASERVALVPDGVPAPEAR
jgi:probable phosphoglycerate mutase